MFLKHIPNLLSITRLLGIIPYGWILLYALPPIQVFVAVLLIATDKIDGTLARRYGFTSRLGALLDTAADAAFILTSWVLFYIRGEFSFALLISLLFARALVFASRVHESVLKKKWNSAHSVADKIMGVLNFAVVLLILAKFPFLSSVQWGLIIINYGAFFISVKERNL